MECASVECACVECACPNKNTNLKTTTESMALQICKECHVVTEIKTKPKQCHEPKPKGNTCHLAVFYLQLLSLLNSTLHTPPVERRLLLQSRFNSHCQISTHRLVLFLVLFPDVPTGGTLTPEMSCSLQHPVDTTSHGLWGPGVHNLGQFICPPNSCSTANSARKHNIFGH